VPNPHVVAIADATEQLIKAPGRRAAEVAAARSDGLSYPTISREVYLLLRQREIEPEHIDGAGIGPDNLRKINGGTE
jgi:hypothetical protein